MPNVQTVPGSEIEVNTPGAGVHVDDGSVGATFRGAQAMAGAVSDIGDMAGHLAGQLQRAREAGIAADVDLKMRAGRQSLIESLRNDSNEANWKQTAEETADKVRDDIFSDNAKLPPGMRQQVDTAYKSWRGSLMIETNTLANVQTINRAWGRTKQDYQEKLRDGDAPGAMANLELARRTKIADPAEIDALERSIPRTIATNYIETGLNENPKGTLDMLKSGATLPVVDQNGEEISPKKAFSAKELQQLTNTARVRTDAWQKENFEQMIAKQVDPTTGYVSEALIEDGVKSGQIDAVTGRNFIAAQDRHLKQQVREEDALRKAGQREDTARFNADNRNQYNLTMAKIHDPTAWGVDPDGHAKELIAEAAKIADPVLRQQAINGANKELASVKKTGQTSASATERQMIELMNRDRQTQGAMLPLSISETAQEEKPSFLGIGAKGGRTGSVPGEVIPAQTKYSVIPGGIGAINKMTDEEIKANYGLDASKDSVIQEINTHSAKLQSEMRDWFKTPEGQKATFDQANEHRMKLERPWVMEAVRSSLEKKAPAVATTKEEVDALPSGAIFMWNGRKLTKN